MALRAGGVFRTVPPTTHFTPDVPTLRRLTGSPIEVTTEPDGPVAVRVGDVATAG